MRWRAMPMAVRLPLVVVAFMATVAAIVSWQVLSRLDEAQARRLRDVAAAHLDGLAAALIDPVVLEDVWEVFDTLDRARQDHGGLRPVYTVVASPEGRVLAASDPRAYPSWSMVPTAFASQARPASELGVRADGARALARRDLSSGGRGVGSVYAGFDLAPFQAERRSVQLTLLATNLGITLALAMVAWLTVRRMVRPLRTLSRHLRTDEDNDITPVPAGEMGRVGAEGRHLYAAFNRMAMAVRDREVLARKLAEEERLASLGRLASGMAHEINNPLGGLFNAIDTLKAHGEKPEVRKRGLDLVERGLEGIRDVVRATLVTHRADRDGRDVVPGDLDDLWLLVAPEIRRRGLVLTWDNAVRRPVGVPATAVRQVVLNLLLNAAQATPADGEVSLAASATDDGAFVVTVADTGCGMDADGPGIPDGRGESRPGHGGPGNGLGLTVVRRLVAEMGGAIVSERRDPAGTIVHVTVPDRRSRAGGMADVA